MNRQPIEQLRRELHERQSRLGTAAELPADLERVLSLAHEINNRMAVDLLRSALDGRSTEKPVTVAIVEDDAELCEMLRRAIGRARSLSFVGRFPNGESALAGLPALAPDVVVMDLQLPGMSGIECTRTLKRLLPAIRVLVLTMFMDSDRLFEAFAAGAEGYLLKRTARPEIVAAIEQIGRGRSSMSAELARRIVESSRSDGQRAEPHANGRDI